MPLRVPYQKVCAELTHRFLATGFSQERATLCAQLFADATRDGVYSHGVNRLPRFLEMIENGRIRVDATPVLEEAMGALERWNGQFGPGNLNAFYSMRRAMELAGQYGIGAVALRDTNHWMRGGSYGWQAAEAGYIGMCWTNTLPNLPPWGATEALIGNNPLVLAVPRPKGHVVLDMAMSQFSYGALAEYRKRGQSLPVIGGFDSEGHITTDAAAIETSGRPLPIGFWKGSGLALVLDLIAAMLSRGKATHQIPRDPLQEVGLSQVFIAIRVDSQEYASRIADDAIAFVQGQRSNASVRYPGERTLALRVENLEKGVPIEEEIWQIIIA